MKTLYHKCKCNFKTKNQILEKFWPPKKSLLYPKDVTINNYNISIPIEEMRKFCIHDRTLLRECTKKHKLIWDIHYYL